MLHMRVLSVLTTIVVELSRLSSCTAIFVKGLAAMFQVLGNPNSALQALNPKPYQDPPCTLNWGYMVPNSGYLGPLIEGRRRV